MGKLKLNQGFYEMPRQEQPKEYTEEDFERSLLRQQWDLGDKVLHVQITDEGVIADVIDQVSGEILSTWGATASELAEEYCH